MARFASFNGQLLNLRAPQPVRALKLAEAVLPPGRDTDYILRLLRTKARHTEAKQPAKEKRKATRRILRAAGETPKTKSDWRRAADLWFGRFIKMRDSFGDVWFCVTCKAIRPYEEIQCGHWRRRENWATRFDERNCHAQGKCCNHYKGGAEKKHEEVVIMKHGQAVADELIRLSSQKYQRKPSAKELEAIAIKYKAKALELGWKEND